MRELVVCAVVVFGLGCKAKQPAFDPSPWCWLLDQETIHWESVLSVAGDVRDYQACSTDAEPERGRCLELKRMGRCTSFARQAARVAGTATGYVDALGALPREQVVLLTKPFKDFRDRAERLAAETNVCVEEYWRRAQQNDTTRPEDIDTLIDQSVAAGRRLVGEVKESNATCGRAPASSR